MIYNTQPSDIGRRIDEFLSRAIPLSRSAVQRLIQEGEVRVNGKNIKKNHLLSGAETIEVSLPQPTETDTLPQNIPLNILFEDDHMLVVNKPRGMVVHPAPGNPSGTLVNALLAHCGATLSGIGGKIRPGIVHRIDKDTSGLLAVAKTDFAHAALSAQLKNHTLFREYQAVVRGNIKEDSGQITGNIGRNPKNRKKMAVVEGGKPAITHFSVVARYNGYTHVTCRLETGRTHQIRVHLASLGHPLAGDTVYGSKGDKSRLSGQCLHAGRIGFAHPLTNESMTFSAPLPQYFADFLKKLENR